MIVIKYIPNILKDEGRIIKELPFVVNKTLQEYLTDTEFELNESKVIVTGKVEKDLTATLKDGDEVIITPKINVPALVFIFGANATFWMGLFNVIAITTTVLSVAYSIYSICTQPKTPSFGTTGEGLDEGSPTYAWDGIANTQDVGAPIPICYGNHGIGGNRIIKL